MRFDIPELKEMSRYIRDLQRYSDALNFIQKIANGEMNHMQIITEAKTFFVHYPESKKKEAEEE